MSTIIYSCNYGLATDGLVVSNENIKKIKIFLDDPENLIGFRTSLRTHTEVVQGIITEYIEVGHFMEMLYEGSVEAFEILNRDEDDIDFSLYDFSILKSEQEELVSMKLIDNLLNKSRELYEGIDDPNNLSRDIGLAGQDFFVTMGEYNNKSAFNCIKYLLLAKKVLSDGKLVLTNANKQVLQALLDGRFSLTTIKEVFEKYTKEIEEELVIKEIRNVPGQSYMNSLLLKIRNVEFNQLNVHKEK